MTGHSALTRIVLTLTIGLTIQTSGASTGCVGDVNNNHVTDINDLLMVINNWGSCGGCAADTNANGIVNIDDMLAVISNWGACPCLPQYGCPGSGVRLWCENFELGSYLRWTGGYNDWSSCAVNGFSTAQALTPTHSHHSQVLCTAGDSHRGYGGLRFQGDTVLPSFTIPSSGGIDAPNGVVLTYWSWLSTPHTFSPTQWMSFLTITDDCSNNWTGVIGLNLDDSTRRLKPSHMSSVTYAPGAPAFPLNQWVRTTVYVNYYQGSMHVWQNGTKIASATFTRPIKKMCQWHFGLYASGNNSNIVLFEEDLSIVKLLQPLTNFNVEPWFQANLLPCP